MLWATFRDQFSLSCPPCLLHFKQSLIRESQIPFIDLYQPPLASLNQRDFWQISAKQSSDVTNNHMRISRDKNWLLSATEWHVTSHATACHSFDKIRILYILGTISLSQAKSLYWWCKSPALLTNTACWILCKCHVLFASPYATWMTCAIKRYNIALLV